MEYPELIQATCLPLSDKGAETMAIPVFPSLLSFRYLHPDGLSPKVHNLFQILWNLKSQKYIDEILGFNIVQNKASAPVFFLSCVIQTMLFNLLDPPISLTEKYRP